MKARPVLEWKKIVLSPSCAYSLLCDRFDLKLELMAQCHLFGLFDHPVPRSCVP